jgi:hypothetical protein
VTLSESLWKERDMRRRAKVRGKEVAGKKKKKDIFDCPVDCGRREEAAESRGVEGLEWVCGAVGKAGRGVRAVRSR